MDICVKIGGKWIKAQLDDYDLHGCWAYVNGNLQYFLNENWGLLW